MQLKQPNFYQISSNDVIAENIGFALLSFDFYAQ